MTTETLSYSSMQAEFCEAGCDQRIILAKSHEVAARGLECALRVGLQRQNIWLIPWTSKTSPSLKGDDGLCIRIVDPTAPKGEWALASPAFQEIKTNVLRLLPDHYPHTSPDAVYISTLDARYMQGGDELLNHMLHLRYGHKHYNWDYDFNIGNNGITRTKKSGRTAHYVLYDNLTNTESDHIPEDVTQYITRLGRTFWPELTLKLGSECTADPKKPAYFASGFTPF